MQSLVASFKLAELPWLFMFCSDAQSDTSTPSNCHSLRRILTFRCLLAEAGTPFRSLKAHIMDSEPASIAALKGGKYVSRSCTSGIQVEL